MCKSSLITFGRTFLVTLTILAGSFAPAAQAKRDSVKCQEELLAAKAANESAIGQAMAALDHFYATGVATFADQNPGVLVQSNRTDGEILAILVKEADLDLRHASSEYVLATLSLSGFCGHYGLIQNYQRMRSAISLIGSAPWLSREKAKEIETKIKALLPDSKMPLAGGC